MFFIRTCIQLLFCFVLFSYALFATEQDLSPEAGQSPPALLTTAFEDHHYGYDLSAKQATYINLNLPTDKMITVKNKILVKGLFFKNGRVLVNNEPIILRAGRFAAGIQFSKPGMYLIRFDFIDNDDNHDTLYRRVAFLPGLPKSHPHNLVTRNIDAMLRGRENNIKQDVPLTREELARLLVLATRLNYKNPSALDVIDVPAHYRYAPYIYTAIHHNLLLMLPDGTFHPKDIITKAQGVVLAVGLLNFEKSEAHPVSYFKDIPRSHFAANAIAASVDNKMLPLADFFRPDEPITVRQFWGLLVKGLEYRNALKPAVDFEDTAKFQPPADMAVSGKEIELTPVATPNVPQVKPVERVLTVKMLQAAPTHDIVPVKTHVVSPLRPVRPEPIMVSADIDEEPEAHPTANLSDFRELYPDIVIPGLKDKYSISKPRLVIKGLIKKRPEAYTLRINGLPVKIARDGNFIAKVNVLPGRSTVVFQVNQRSFDFIVERRATYPDVPVSYWGYRSIHYLLNLRYLLESRAFKPNGMLTRQELAYSLSRLFDLEDVTPDEFAVKDVPGSSLYRKAIMNVLANSVMYLDDSGNFKPEERVKRADVIVYLSAAVSIEENARQMPYADVPLDHYAVDEIAHFKDHGILSSTHNFNPENYITRAQFVAILSKLPKVKDQIGMIGK